MVSVSSSPAQENRPLYAMGLRLLSALMISINFACVKWASDRGVHVVETLFYRQLFSLPVAMVALMLGPGLMSIRNARIGLHASRTAVGMTGMMLNFTAIILLPLAEATTIGFSVPIFATILSVLFLGERPGIHRWLAVLVGFLGVVIIINPSAAHEDISGFGVSIAIAGAIATSLVSLLLRQIGKTEAPTTTVFYFAALSLFPLGIAMLFFGQWHDPVTWLILLLMGTAGGVAQLLMTSSLRWGPVSLVLPMDYSSLLWSTLFGWMLWTAWPGSSTWVGAVVIAASSIYIGWRERKRNRENLAHRHSHH
ncbi:MAG: DMT family transporter [Sphingobium sp.]|nr:DMT family transporter [Sphingobium sp.]